MIFGHSIKSYAKQADCPLQDKKRTEDKKKIWGRQGTNLGEEIQKSAGMGSKKNSPPVTVKPKLKFREPFIFVQFQESREN